MTHPQTPSTGWVDYHQRMAKIIAYIHDHLHEPLTLHILAEVAHLSPYHWHRVYHALLGETLAQTVRRLRLHRATGDLSHSSLPVATIASRIGYPNVQSFTRAFRTVYGQSPSSWRAAQTSKHTHGLASRNAQPQRLIAKPTRLIQSRHDWQVHIQNVSPIIMAGLPHRGSYMNVGKAFESAFVHLSALKAVTPHSRWFAVFEDDPFAVLESQLQSKAGLTLPDTWPSADIPKPLSTFKLGGCTCAVLHYKGPYSEMRFAYQWLYGTWLPHTGYETGEQPVFEEYLNNPRDTKPADLLTDIYLPIKPPPH